MSYRAAYVDRHNRVDVTLLDVINCLIPVMGRLVLLLFVDYMYRSSTKFGGRQ